MQLPDWATVFCYISNILKHQKCVRNILVKKFDINDFNEEVNDDKFYIAIVLFIELSFFNGSIQFCSIYGKTFSVHTTNVSSFSKKNEWILKYISRAIVECCGKWFWGPLILKIPFIDFSSKESSKKKCGCRGWGSNPRSQMWTRA